MKIRMVPLPKGLWYVLSANFFFSVMTAGVYGVKILDPSISPFMVSFIRVAVNLFAIVIPVVLQGRAEILFGDRSWSLWLRGLFGGFAVMLFFYSIQVLGPSESTFIQCTNGIFIVLLCPFVLREKFSLRAFMAVIGSVIGLYILFDPSFTEGRTLGQIAAFASGFFAALAALMIAKSGKNNSPVTVVFYFCFVALFVHLAYFALEGGFQIPKGNVIWFVMFLVGISSTFAQLMTTKAYQLSPASLVASVSYFGPVLNTLWGVVIFHQLLTGKSLAGCAIILVCGVVLPFLKNSCPKKPAVNIGDA